MIEELMDINDVAKGTKLAVGTIRKYVLLGQIPYHKIHKAIKRGTFAPRARLNVPVSALGDRGVDKRRRHGG